MSVIATPLVGRDEVLAELRRRISSTVDGAGGCLILNGPAGIGKSRLLEAVLGEASAAGMAVTHGRATELDRMEPLATLTTALRRIQHLGSWLTTAVRQGHGRFWMIDQLAAELEICA